MDSARVGRTLLSVQVLTLFLIFGLCGAGAPARVGMGTASVGS